MPTVAFVAPNLNNDMHDGTVAQGDSWLKANLGAYASWAMSHNSLLVVTWDEDDDSAGNRIPTVLVGPMVKTGSSAQKVNHYNLLRTLEEMYGLTYLGNSASVKAFANVWQALPSNPTAQSCLFSWAEKNYPDYLSPPQTTTLSQPPYSYRYYPTSNAYLGVSGDNDHLYYLGKLTGTQLSDLGPVADWYSKAGCI